MFVKFMRGWDTRKTISAVNFNQLVALNAVFNNTPDNKSEKIRVFKAYFEAVIVRAEINIMICASLRAKGSR